MTTTEESAADKARKAWLSQQTPSNAMMWGNERTAVPFRAAYEMGRAEAQAEMETRIANVLTMARAVNAAYAIYDGQGGIQNLLAQCKDLRAALREIEQSLPHEPEWGTPESMERIAAGLRAYPHCPACYHQTVGARAEPDGQCFCHCTNPSHRPAPEIEQSKDGVGKAEEQG